MNNSTIVGLAAALLENRRYRSNDSYLQFHHKLMARAEKLCGDSPATLRQWPKAMEYRTDDDLNLTMVSALVDAGRFDEARNSMEKAEGRLPKNPLRRYNSEIRLRELRVFLDAAERAAHSDNQFDNGIQTEVD